MARRGPEDAARLEGQHRKIYAQRFDRLGTADGASKTLNIPKKGRIGAKGRARYIRKPMKG